MGSTSLRTVATANRSSAASALWLQRKCACGDCAECRKKRVLLTPARGLGELTGVPPVVHEVLQSTGRPLDPATQGFFESRFGHDFSRVRIHADAPAAEAAHAVDASAYTVGEHLVFGSGRYAPGTGSGSRLLAHELAHVVQQAAAPTSTSPSAGIAPSEHPLEYEADRAADRFAAEGSFNLSSTNAAPLLQRQPAPAGPPQADDCSGYESDPVSFSLHVARHVAKTHIDPKLAADGKMPVCEAPLSGQAHSTDCHVPFEKGPTILVMWTPRTRRTIGRFDSGGQRKRFVYEYSCRGGVLTLKFLLLHTAPAPASAPTTGPSTAP